SDLTATLLGRAFDASTVTLWKDVPGVLTADPRVVRDARLIPRVHIREAAELAYYGAKVLHPRALLGLSENTRLFIRPLADPGAPGTEISAHRDRAAEKRFPGGSIAMRGDLGAWCARVGEGADEEPRILAQSEKSAWVEHLRAIVRELRCFTDVNARNEPRVANDARVGGQYSRDVLPERDGRCVEGATEQCRRQIGSAAAEGDDRAIFCPRDEAGHHRDDTAAHQWCEGFANR